MIIRVSSVISYDEANDVITVHESEIESAPEGVQKDTDVSIEQIVKQENRLLNIIDANAVLDKESSLVYGNHIIRFIHNPADFNITISNNDNSCFIGNFILWQIQAFS